MEAFLTPRQRARKLRDYERRRNPAPNRTNSERLRINRALSAIKERISYWLKESDFRPMKGWLPFEDVVTARDDDYLRDFYAAYSEDGIVESDGYLVQFHDKGIKATNYITAITWYVNQIEGEFLLAKPVYSPLPCKEWGRLPLTLAQWRIIAPELILSTQLWQWLHAVRHYLTDDTFEVGGFMGWHLQECIKVKSLTELANGPGYLFKSESVQASEKAWEWQGWTAHIIYRHITDAFSLNANGE